MPKPASTAPSLLAVAALLLGTTATFADTPVAPNPEDAARPTARQQILREYPHIVAAMSSSPHAGFGGPRSQAVGTRMYSRSDAAAIADVRAKLSIEEIAKGTWFIRIPYVNIVVFETSEGLVLIDSGYAAAGPALIETLHRISKKPVHTIVFTHHHADHAFGAWALLAEGQRPRIVAERSFLHELDIDLKLANYTNVRLNDQAPQDVPRSRGDVVLPTDTFSDQTALTIGGETFVLHHARGETADQIWVHAPARGIVVSADYHQPFLPNAGNGKRRQRYLTEWAQALRAMIAASPNLVLPMHGPAIAGHASIEDRLGAVADALESIDQQVVAGLNAGLRRDQVVDRVSLPQPLASRPDMDTYYNRVSDVARMSVREYSGWWDDVPSHWSPSPMAAQAREFVALSGGQERVLARLKELLPTDAAMACHLADWAWLAAPEDRTTLEASLAAYANRIRPGVPAQEINVYLAQLSELKRRLDALRR